MEQYFKKLEENRMWLSEHWKEIDPGIRKLVFAVSQILPTCSSCSGTVYAFHPTHAEESYLKQVLCLASFIYRERELEIKPETTPAYVHVPLSEVPKEIFNKILQEVIQPSIEETNKKLKNLGSKARAYYRFEETRAFGRYLEIGVKVDIKGPALKVRANSRSQALVQAVRLYRKVKPYLEEFEKERSTAVSILSRELASRARYLKIVG